MRISFVKFPSVMCPESAFWTVTSVSQGFTQARVLLIIGLITVCIIPKAAEITHIPSVFLGLS